MVSSGPRIQDMVGVGLYTPTEAGRFARVQTQTINGWFFGNAAGDQVVESDFEASERLLSFSNLIEAVAISNLRRQRISRGITLERIRDAVRFAENELHIPNILSRKHVVYVFDGKLWLEYQGEIIGLNSGERTQLLSRIAEPFLEELEYDVFGQARSWSPLSRGAFTIQLNANRRFGQPVVEPYGILAQALSDSIDSEGSIDAAAAAHEVDRDAVVLAQKYMKEYLLAHAA